MDFETPPHDSESPIDQSRPVQPIASSRSCLTCHRRKVRCDRRNPCNHCSRNNIPCIFPSANRPRRSLLGTSLNGNDEDDAADEITSRLQKLESIVEDLRGKVPKKTNASRSAAFLQPYGRLLLDPDGKAKYLHSAFWMHINVQLEQHVDTNWLSNDPKANNHKSSNRIMIPSTASALDSSQTFIHGPLDGLNLQSLHPLPSQIPYLWHVWKTNIDPMTKCFHVPTMQKIIETIATDMSHLPPAIETLLFAIYYGAITSLDDADVLKDMGVEKQPLLKRFRFAIEQSLAKAQFLIVPEILTFQALVLFLLFLRKNGDFRHSAMLIPLAVRIAQSLGLHRDGTQLQNLSPFRTEIHRRLFWGVVVLDRRASEDIAMDPMFVSGVYDTHPPLNINDSDLLPQAAHLPIERKGFTESSFVLIRIKTLLTSEAVQKMILTAADGIQTQAEIDQLQARCNEEWKNCAAYIREHYIGADATPDIRFRCEAMMGLIMAKLRLMTQCLIPSMSEDGVTVTIRRPPSLLRVACISEMFEFNHLGTHHPSLKHFRWVFISYTRWHGSSMMLTEMLRHPWSSILERGWEAMHNVFQDSGPGELEQLAERTVMVVPFQKLYHLVTEYRRSELARLRADPEAARQLHAATVHPTGLGLFEMSFDEYIVKADKSWRQLVGLNTGTSQSSPVDVEGTQSGYNKLYDVIMSSGRQDCTEDEIANGHEEPVEYDFEALSQQEMQDFYNFATV